MNKTFTDRVPSSAHGYTGFPLDHLVNFTSACGYLIPVCTFIVDPGDKIIIKNLLRTRTQPLATPAMATIIERVEWFAVPVEQLDKAFSPKFFGINDVESDLLPTTFSSEYLPYVQQKVFNEWLIGKPLTQPMQGQPPISEPTFSEAKRLADALEYAHLLGETSHPSTDPVQWSHSMLAYFPAAYQKIYYDHYRLTDRIPNDPEAYNLDSFHNNPNITANTRLDKLYMLHKRPYNLDYFTSMDVSPLFGSQSINSSGVDLGKVQQWLSGLSGVQTSSPAGSTVFPDGGQTTSDNVEPTTVRLSTQGSSSTATTAAVAGVFGAINPANIRSLFAVEKLLEVTRKAKKHYDKQVLAHFGVEVPKGRSGECFKIGTHEQYIQIGDVISNSTTVDTNDNLIGALGELAGRGSSKSESSKFTFEAKTHCIIMGIYSAEPIMSYTNYGTSRQNTMTHPSSWYKSEFDKLGQQPVFLYELYDHAFDPNSGIDTNTIVGWQDRYMQLKAAYNRSFAGANTPYFNEWFLNRSLNPAAGLTRYWFEVWPTDMNNILQVPFTGNVTSGTGITNQVYAYDYLVNQLYCDVVKVSKKSIHGTPNM